MQIKPTIRYHFIPTLMSIIKVSDNDKCWKGCGEIGILIYCWWGYNMMQLLWKSLAVPQKIKHRITMWPSNSAIVDMPKRIKTMSTHSLCKNIISQLFVIAKRGNISNVHQLMNGQTQCGSSRLGYRVQMWTSTCCIMGEPWEYLNERSQGGHLMSILLTLYPA